MPNKPHRPTAAATRAFSSEPLFELDSPEACVPVIGGLESPTRQSSAEPINSVEEGVAQINSIEDYDTVLELDTYLPLKAEKELNKAMGSVLTESGPDPQGIIIISDSEGEEEHAGSDQSFMDCEVNDMRVVDKVASTEKSTVENYKMDDADIEKPNPEEEVLQESMDEENPIQENEVPLEEITAEDSQSPELPIATFEEPIAPETLEPDLGSNSGATITREKNLGSPSQILQKFKRQKLEIRVPRQEFNDNVSMYAPRFAILPASETQQGLFDHHGHPFRFQDAIISACDLLDGLEKKKERRHKQVLAGYVLREFEITTLKGQAEEPFIFQDYPKGMLFSGVIYGQTKAGFAQDGILQSIHILRPDAAQFAIQVFGVSATHPGVHLLLRRPSSAYRPLYSMFHWNAVLVRNLVDWVLEVGRVTMDMLCSEFNTWLDGRFGKDPQYHAWKAEIATGGDYRHYLSNVRFLLAKHLRDERANTALLENSYMFQQEEPKTPAGFEKTLVTPTVYHWFKASFKNQMHTLDPNDMQPLVEPPAPVLPKDTWSMDHPRIIRTKDGRTTKMEVESGTLAVGDFVEVYRDDAGPDDGPDDAWIARIIGFGDDHFFLVWMYSINQTFLFNAGSVSMSPFERFYSLHCECEQPPFLLSVIKRKVEIEMMPSDIKTCKSYFCRYFYDQDGLSFVDLDQAPLNHIKTDALLCKCTLEDSRQVAKRTLMRDRRQIGCAFTIDLSGRGGHAWVAPEPRLLTVGQLQAYQPQSETFSFRIFPRIREVSAYMELLNKQPHSAKCELNELLYSPKVIQCTLASIVAPCHIAFIPKEARCDPLPINLKHRGSGNQFFFTYATDEDYSEIHEPSNPFLKQSFPHRSELTKEILPLPALDLFSGSGSLGMGVGDGDLAHSQWAVDFEPTATEAYRASAAKELCLFTESVNTSLRNILNKDSNYPSEGEVGLIVAGTPCQGYSLLNRNRESETALSKSSMITSLASFVDHLRPTHVLMEQIINFAQFRLNISGQGGLPPQNPFRQLLQLYLKLGYQVRFLMLSANNHGTCQSRNRIFIWCTKRGAHLPIHPVAAHLAQTNTYLSVGAPGNLRIPSSQSPEKAALPPITVREMIGDLPPLGLGSRPCNSTEISFHNVASSKDYSFERFERIPLGFGLANSLGLEFRASLPNSTVAVPESILTIANQREKCKSFARVDPDGQISTISTSIGYKSTFPSFHFSESRLLSVRECARMQGFLDTDQFAGKLTDQYRLIGNAVPRCVAFALGLGLAPHIDRHEIKKILSLEPTKDVNHDSIQVTIHGDFPFIILASELQGSFSNFLVSLSTHVDLTQPFRLVLSSGIDGARWLIHDDSSLEAAAKALSNDSEPCSELWLIPISLSPDLTEHM